MNNAPNPLIKKLINDLAEVRSHIEEINKKLANPNLFDEIEAKKEKDKNTTSL